MLNSCSFKLYIRIPYTRTDCTKYNILVLKLPLFSYIVLVIWNTARSSFTCSFYDLLFLCRLRQSDSSERASLLCAIEHILLDFGGESLAPSLLSSHELHNKLLSELLAALALPPASDSASALCSLSSAHQSSALVHEPLSVAQVLLSLIAKVRYFYVLVDSNTTTDGYDYGIHVLCTSSPYIYKN